MRRFQFQKLVRDKIVEKINISGNTPHYRVLNDPQFLQELKNKLLEEIHEATTESNQAKFADELADIQEILDHLYQLLNISPAHLKELQHQKNEANGSFLHRHYISHVDVLDDAKEIDYYLANPHKYPELPVDEK